MHYSEFISKIKELKTITSVSGKGYRIEMVSNDRIIHHFAYIKISHIIVWNLAMRKITFHGT